MKKTFTLLVGILVYFLLVDSAIFQNGFNDRLEKDFYERNTNYYNLGTNYDFYTKSDYLKKDVSSFVKNTDNFKPKNKQELLNVYYTILNNGWTNFSFYCDESYNCIDDIESLSKEKEDLSMINQLVHPYNSFSSIESSYTNRRIDVTLNKKYSKEDINKIDENIDSVIDKLGINKASTVKEKIRLFHDYLANNNVYDKDKENGSSSYHSDTAIGTLFEGHSICSGYTDAMSIFLDKINLENYKIANNEHTWNVVNIDNTWYHIDLTWDDPITTSGSNIITYDYFLITTLELNNKNEEDHNYHEMYSFVNED